MWRHVAQVISTDITSGKTLDPVPESTAGTQPGVPLIKKIDIELSVKEVRSLSALVSWRFFSTEEKQFIDGVQIR